MKKEAPELADAVEALFDAYRHKTIATLRRDGSPRISGIEVEFADGDLRVGMMPGSRKLADITRDNRVSIHSGSADPDDDNPGAWPGDAKVAGQLLPGPPKEDGQPGDSFALELSEVVTTKVADSADHLEIRSWHPGRGTNLVKRA